MQAIEYVRSIPRFVATRALSHRWPLVGASRIGLARLTDVSPPALPGPLWTRVEPILSGICGSDLATITAQGSPYFSPLTSTPFVFGHEVVGLVVETGSEVSRVEVGDRVCLAPPLHCEVRGIEEACDPCRSGDPGHCRNTRRGDIAAGIQTGYCRDTGGGWSRGFVAHEAQLFHVPESMTDDAAVLVEPLSCSLNAAEGIDSGPDDTILVIGCGTIGILTIAALRGVGVEARIVAVAKYDHQAETALRFGADEIVMAAGDHRSALAATLEAELHKPELGPPIAIGGADVVFDCVGSSRTLDDALRFSRDRGVVIVVGMPGIPRGVDWTALWHKELVVRGCYTADEPTFERALALAARLEGLSDLVGARYPLEEFRNGIAAALEAGSRGITKVVFTPGERRESA